MLIYVAFRHYRQINGEYTALQLDKAFTKKDDAESFMKNQQTTWYESREVPVDAGGTMPIEFQGWLTMHEVDLV